MDDKKFGEIVMRDLKDIKGKLDYFGRNHRGISVVLTIDDKSNPVITYDQISKLKRSLKLGRISIQMTTIQTIGEKPRPCLGIDGEYK